MTERSGSTKDIRIAPVNQANRALVTALQLTPEQMDFVASNADSLREARSDRDARPRVVMAGDRVVGGLCIGGRSPLLQRDTGSFQEFQDTRSDQSHMLEQGPQRDCDDPAQPYAPAQAVDPASLGAPGP